MVGGGDFKAASPAPSPSRSEEQAVQLRKARWLWSRRKPIIGSVAETYLRARGYNGPLPAALGYLPPDGELAPSLIAAYGVATEPEPGAVAVPDDAVVGVHLIKLKPDGSDRLRDDPKCKFTIGKKRLRRADRVGASQ